MRYHNIFLLKVRMILNIVLGFPVMYRMRVDGGNVSSHVDGACIAECHFVECDTSRC
jgi:hypothetical protein